MSEAVVDDGGVSITAGAARSDGPDETCGEESIVEVLVVVGEVVVDGTELVVTVGVVVVGALVVVIVVGAVVVGALVVVVGAGVTKFGKEGCVTTGTVEGVVEVPEDVVVCVVVKEVVGLEEPVLGVEEIVVGEVVVKGVEDNTVVLKVPEVVPEGVPLEPEPLVVVGEVIIVWLVVVDVVVIVGLVGEVVVVPDVVCVGAGGGVGEDVGDTVVCEFVPGTEPYSKAPMSQADPRSKLL